MYSTFPITCSFIKQSRYVSLIFLQAFHRQLRVQHVGGAVIPPFRASLVTKLHKFIRLSLKNPLIFIRIQLDEHARNYVAISSSLSP